MKNIASSSNSSAANFVGRSPRNLAFWIAPLVIFIALVACSCDEAYTAEELQSDPLPNFEDSAFEGSWLLNGDEAEFRRIEHGVYRVGSPESENDAITFQMKRVDNLLFMEAKVEDGGPPVFRPCWISVSSAALDFHCLRNRFLDTYGIAVEKKMVGTDEMELVTESPQRLRSFYVEQARNRDVFERTWSFTRPDPAQVARLRRKALLGDAESQEMLAEALRDGAIVKQDREEALEWARRSAESGRPSAQVLYGDLLAQPSLDQTEQNDPEALLWYRRAAEQGFPLAYSHLGKLLESSTSVRDDEAAVNSYAKGAELGDPESVQQLGIRHSEGRGVLQDVPCALEELESVPEAIRSKDGWMTLTRIYVSSSVPQLRDSKKALYSSERLLILDDTFDAYALAAAAAYQNGLFEVAIRYQQRAIGVGNADEQEQRTKLEQYRLASHEENSDAE